MGKKELILGILIGGLLVGFSNSSIGIEFGRRAG